MSTEPTTDTEPKSVAEAASSGDYRELLVAMRSRIASAVEDPTTPARDLASLTRRLMDISKEIQSIELDASGGPLTMSDIEDEPFDPRTDL